jgi:hypothetical protein
MKYEYKVLMENLNGRCNLVKVDADGRIILNYISMRYSGNV